MTRLCVNPAMSPKPASIGLCELAIAAGVAGQSVTLSFQDFPAPVLCQLWRYCTRYAGSVAIRHIHSQTDVRKLAGEISDVRLALVYTPRLRGMTAWIIQMTGAEEEERYSQPALFCCGGSACAEDNPGATLILRGDPPEHAALGRSLLLPDSELPDWDIVPPDLNIQIEPRVTAALSSNWGSGDGLDRLRDRQVFHGLIAGATLVRSLRQNPVDANLTTTAEDYELVRRLLQSRVVAGADEAYDPLAADMVARANVFLAVRSMAGSGIRSSAPIWRWTMPRSRRRSWSPAGRFRTSATSGRAWYGDWLGCSVRRMATSVSGGWGWCGEPGSGRHGGGPRSMPWSLACGPGRPSRSVRTSMNCGAAA